MAPNDALSVVVFRDGDIFVAQCLEYDISGEGCTAEAAITEFENTYIRHILVAKSFNRPPFENVPPADDAYWQKFSDARAASGSTDSRQFPGFIIQRQANQASTPAAAMPEPRFAVAMCG